jgi:hypothetical protein
MYGIQGNESTPDQNINHFINAIRAVNKPEAFDIQAGALDRIGNALISGREASDTYLKANVDLWIPSFAVASRMDVGSGTVTGEVARAIKKLEQKIEDFKEVCKLAGQYIPEAVKARLGEVGEALLKGLIDFALDAAKILAASTAIGALIGALFGGVGAVPGAKIGFEVGLLILEFCGLYALIESILAMAGNLFSRLGQFVTLVWTANGDKRQLDAAAKMLASALATMASAILMAIAAYVTKKGMSALGKTKFVQRIGERPLAQWLSERQRLTTTRTEAQKALTSGPAQPKQLPPGPAEPKALPAAGKTRNTYPEFDRVQPGLQKVAGEQTARLSQQLGIPIPKDRVLEAPWIGRIRSGKGEVTSASTSQGWMRNESRYWAEFKRRFPDDYAQIGPGRTVTPELAQRYGWPKEVVGQKLVHHHIDNGPITVAIPESLHKKLSGVIHAKPTVVGTPD